MSKAWILLIGLVAVEATVSTAAAVCPEHLKFLKAKCAQWQATVLPESLPAARGNAFADNEAAAGLGMKIFYDNRFSRSGSGVACVNCHDPEHSFAELKATSHTIGDVARNAPDLLNAAWYTRAHFWDGKVENLWSAPLFTFEQPEEMGSTRLSVVHTLASIYKIRYEKVFGPLPDLSDTKRFPASGKPGTPQFDAMSQADQNLVNHLYANVGKALEAYVRKVSAGRSRFDDFLTGSANSLKPDAQRGMVAFTRHGCDGCHSGPTFTDQSFHNLGYPGSHPKDPARAGGLAFARQWPFTSTGPFADQIGAGAGNGGAGAGAVAGGAGAAAPGASTAAGAPAKAGPTDPAAGDPAGFRTPTLRNVALTPPYGHDGSFATLELAIRAHAPVLPGHAAPNAQDEHDIVELLRSLSGRPPRPPWNYWPGG